MNFNNITSEDLVGKGVEGLPDTPGLTTQEMQAKFDELVKDVMVPKFNALINELRTIAGIKSVDQTVVDSESSIPTGKAVLESFKKLSKAPVYKSESGFPETGEYDRFYVDDTVLPRIIYTWDSKIGYVMTGGSGSGSGSETILPIIPLTYAEYEQLPETEKLRNDVMYDITDKREGGVRFGATDISGIGDGTVTGAISALNTEKLSNNKIFKFFESSSDTVTLDLVNESIYELTLVASTIMAKYIVRPISNGVRSWYIGGSEDYLTFSSVSTGKVVLKPKYGSTNSCISYQCLY